MKKTVSTAVVALAVVAFAGAVVAEEKFPTQGATVKTTVTTPDGKVVKEDVVTDTTKGADTATQYRELQKAKEKEAAEQQEATTDKQDVEKAVKKKTIKKKAKKAKAKAKAKSEAAPAETPAPEAK